MQDLAVKIFKYAGVSSKKKGTTVRRRKSTEIFPFINKINLLTVIKFDNLLIESN